MLAVTFNCPRQAFNDPCAPFFQGASVDDMLYPIHLMYKFMAMRPLPTFAAFDVHKNPTIEQDFAEYAAHLERVFEGSTHENH